MLPANGHVSSVSESMRRLMRNNRFFIANKSKREKKKEKKESVLITKLLRRANISLIPKPFFNLKVLEFRRMGFPAPEERLLLEFVDSKNPEEKKRSVFSPQRKDFIVLFH